LLVGDAEEAAGGELANLVDTGGGAVVDVLYLDLAPHVATGIV
jgi:hypothetical protein